MGNWDTVFQMIENNKTNCYDCGKIISIDSVEFTAKNDEDVTKVPRCHICSYRVQKKWKQSQGESKIQMLYDTEEFLIDYEVYNRGLYTNYEEFDSPQDPMHIHFEYEGQEYSLFELTLYNLDPDAEEGADYYETEPCCGMSENVEVDIYDMQWKITCWKANETEGINYSYITDLPFNHSLPREILKLAREKWQNLPKEETQFLNKHYMRHAFLNTKKEDK